MNLFFSPHNDDETLFGAFTLIRERPLVVIVTDSWIQYNRGDGITAEQRWQETLAAVELFACPVYRAGLHDTLLSMELVVQLMKKFKGFEKVYAPAIQGGNIHHDMVGEAARLVFKNLYQYTTYTKHELHTVGDIEVKPTPNEQKLKNEALGKYKSQLNLPSTRPHFAAVLDKSEWLIHDK